MARRKPRILEKFEFEEAAQAYLRSLPLEHFMESVPQAHQRKITVASLDLVHARRPDVQVFNELLVQYRFGDPPVLRQVVPDNMVVVHPEPIEATSSFNLPLQPVKPVWMLEYVSNNNKRKDYEDSFQKYEQELKIPFYLIYYPDNEELSLYHLRRGRYRSVLANEQRRHPIEELGVEVAVLDGWVRYWSEGELLPLPAELQDQLDETRKLLDQERRRATAAQRRADKAERRAEQEHLARLQLEQEVARLRAQLGQPPTS
jgi:Uma2 family endonuclease